MWKTEDPVHMYPCTKARDVTTNFFRRRKWNHPSRVMLLSLLSLYASTYWWKIQISQLHYHDGTNFKAEYWLQKSHFETGFKMPVSNWKIHVTKKHLTSPRYIQKKSHCSGKRIKEHTNLFNWADIILTWMPIWVNQIQEFQIVISLVQFSIDLENFNNHLSFGHMNYWKGHQAASPNECRPFKKNFSCFSANFTSSIQFGSYTLSSRLKLNWLKSSR